MKILKQTNYTFMISTAPLTVVSNTFITPANSLGKVFPQMLNGNEWEPMVTNGGRIAKQWENLSGTYSHFWLMGIQW